MEATRIGATSPPEPRRGFGRFRIHTTLPPGTPKNLRFFMKERGMTIALGDTGARAKGERRTPAKGTASLWTLLTERGELLSGRRVRGERRGAMERDVGRSRRESGTGPGRREGIVGRWRETPGLVEEGAGKREMWKGRGLVQPHPPLYNRGHRLHFGPGTWVTLPPPVWRAGV